MILMKTVAISCNTQIHTTVRTCKVGLMLILFPRKFAMLAHSTAHTVTALVADLREVSKTHVESGCPNGLGLACMLPTNEASNDHEICRQFYSKRQ